MPRSSVSTSRARRTTSRGSGGTRSLVARSEEFITGRLFIIGGRGLSLYQTRVSIALPDDANPARTNRTLREMRSTEAEEDINAPRLAR